MSDTFETASLDQNLADLPDAVEYVTPPSGIYLVTLAKGLEEKIVNEHPAVAVEMTIDSVEELSDPKKADECKAGDIASTLFMLDNAQGAGNFKKFSLPIAAKFGLKTGREVINKSKGLKLLVVIKQTFDKEKGKSYTNISRVDVV